jgi:hypothetical protein
MTDHSQRLRREPIDAARRVNGFAGDCERTWDGAVAQRVGIMRASETRCLQWPDHPREHAWEAEQAVQFRKPVWRTVCDRRRCSIAVAKAFRGLGRASAVRQEGMDRAVSMLRMQHHTAG